VFSDEICTLAGTEQRQFGSSTACNANEFKRNDLPGKTAKLDKMLKTFKAYVGDEECKQQIL